MTTLTPDQDREHAEAERRKAVALFRYGVIADLIHAERGQRGLYAKMRERAAQDWEIPGTLRRKLGAETIRGWLSDYRRGGFDALLPKVRRDAGCARAIPQAVADLLCEAKEQHPDYSVTLVIDHVKKTSPLPEGLVLAPSTVHRVLSLAGLMEKKRGEPTPKDRRRFSFEMAGELWMSDVMHGPSVVVSGRQRKTYLIAIIDDATRMVPYAAFALSETASAFLTVLEQAIRRRGIPKRIYVDLFPGTKSRFCARPRYVAGQTPAAEKARGSVESCHIIFHGLPRLDSSPAHRGKEVQMLEQFFIRPETVDRIRSSWLGDAIEKYVKWLSEQAYKARCVHYRVPLLVAFGEFARRRGAVRIELLGGHVDAFVASRLRRRAQPCRSKSARAIYVGDVREPIRQFLHVVQFSIPKSRSATSRPFSEWAPGFFSHLRDERGLSPTTVDGYAYQLTLFEKFVASCRVSDQTSLSPAVLDAFLADRRTHVCARSLGMTCAALRAFLRYLFREGIVQRDLSATVQGPRTYALSEIPRSIRVEDVERMLGLIERRSAVGRRDYAMLLLLVVYGLRAREVAALTLDDLDWHAAVLHVRGRKGGHAATFPLIAEVGEALLDYLQRGRPDTPNPRSLFFRSVAPRAPIDHRIVSCRAKHYLRKAGIDVARPGSHTLRHSCAQRLVDAEFSLKVIGDFLGHRHASTTRIYSKVAIDALREVALGDGEEVL